MPMEFAVECKGVIKDFGTGSVRQRVLHGIDWQVPIGATTFLVGPSGCGKTTLISIIAGLLSATEGYVRILDQEITKMRRSRVVRFRADHLGFIFQQFNLLPSLTAVENAAVSLVVQGVTLATAKRQASVLLDRLGMESNKLKYPNQLSGGQQQRVAIARALVHNPKIVISDEPTASLDAETGHEVMELLGQVASGADRAVIVVTHDNRIFPFADYIATMSDGRIESFRKNSV
ncbi:MAG: ABC transporter ATP-binding protein [Planctomycetota bacterium]|jgi:putative ABC transport system ATP-binding protein|nr:MAG: ABC transporter ATP-binding protein [Planctomycetota bacterium]